MPKISLREYVVRPGDCIASIAATARTTVAALWDLAENAELRELRKDPYVLAEGDRVMVPHADGSTHTLQTNLRHVFRRQATHTDFRVKARHNGKPRANLGFRLVLDGDEATAIEGTSDDEGVVRARIPASAQRGVIEFADGRGALVFQLGALDPIDTLAGVQGRLRNLGHYLQSVDGELGPFTARALRNFQRVSGIAVTGLPDDPTIAALRVAYGR